MSHQSSRPEAQCDEGGVHTFAVREGPGGCGWCKCFCCPCWALYTCAASDGAAGASPLGMLGADQRPDEPTCTKCGLSPDEAAALSQAKTAEANGLRTSKGPQYFTNSNLQINHPSPPSSFPSRYPPPTHTPTPHRQGSGSSSPRPPGSPAPPYGQLAPAQEREREGENAGVERWLSGMEQPQRQPQMQEGARY